MRLAALCLSVLALLSGRAELQRFEAVEPHMGTLVRITVYVAGEQEAREAFRAGFDRIRELDALLSDYRPDSELNRLTTTAVGRPVRVSNDVFTVLRASQDLAEATDGAFDITQGPVIRLWRDARRTGRVPDSAALLEAAGRSGFRKLHLDPVRRTVMLDQPGMALDVGAIGKGYAASASLQALAARGVRIALVAVSGDLAFGDAPPGQPGWRIRVHADDPSLAGVPAVLELTNAAVSTAGSSEQHLDAGGRRYSHIIDPSSRMGVVDDVTVTVVAPGGLEADGLDTAASVLGAKRGLALIESHPAAAALIVRRAGRDVHVFTSTRFRALAAEHGVASPSKDQ
jgi:thiamine biosynthesis lipoprotein